MSTIKWSKLFAFAGLLFLIHPPVYSATFSLTPGDDVIGELQTVTAEQGDTFASLAMEFGLSLDEIKEANPNIKQLRANQEVLLPTQFILPPSKYRDGIVVNMPELRLYFFSHDGRTVDTYPVAMGRPGWRTPVMKTTVTQKETQPIWHVPPDIHDYMLRTHAIDLPDVVPPGPRNPLGPFALHIGNQGYLIHGNNQVSSIGTYASSGCIRMYNEDVTALFPEVPEGAMVYVTNHPYKAGWKGNQLLFKSQHPINIKDEATELGHNTINEVIAEATAHHSTQLNWDKINRVAKARDGVPEQVN
jgi:L,D-transpeptidase ErfK/SrfK